MLDLPELCRNLNPAKAVLFLGAGSSIPSGAPSAVDLARRLEQKFANGRSISSNLTELCSILEPKVGRPALVNAVKDELASLSPTGGLLVLPEFPWPSIYTTNFDLLLEKAYARCARPCVPIRSNYEIGRAEPLDGTPIFKLHGCITADETAGFHARLVLTEQDYDEYARFRETLFQKLKFDLATKDVLFIGHSLKDPDVRAELKDAVALQRGSGAPGRVFALIFERDEDRALLAESTGARVAFGGIDDVMHELATSPRPAPAQIRLPLGQDLILPLELRASTIDVAITRSTAANALRLFNGSPATYADIDQGLTFARYLETEIKTDIRSGRPVTTLVGVAGVGKTTLARRVLEALSREGYLAWEHSSSFPFRSAHWLGVERTAREGKRKALLLVDDSPAFQGQVNSLVDTLVAIGDRALQLVLTGERSQWGPRKKSARIFSAGKVYELSQMEDYDIAQLLNLLSDKPEIRRLVDGTFARFPRARQEREIKRRCRADMYVALKNIFGTEALDDILLREYAHLSEAHQEVYRSVAALEAAGTRVHRQLVLRLSGVRADLLAGLLAILEGLVDEYDIAPEDGIFGWRTRHEVVARTIARYKFADQVELVKLFEDVIDASNPAIYIERRTLNDLCNAEYGIRRVAAEEARVHLYERIIEKAPGERVPRHRLVSELMRADTLERADYALRDAIEAVGLDSPLHRYKILLLVARAQRAERVMEEDRVALLMEAKALAYEGLRRYSDDKYSYLVFSRLASAYFAITKSEAWIDEAVEVLRDGLEKVSDPQLARELRELEQRAFYTPEDAE